MTDLADRVERYHRRIAEKVAASLGAGWSVGYRTAGSEVVVSNGVGYELQVSRFWTKEKGVPRLKVVRHPSGPGSPDGESRIELPFLAGPDRVAAAIRKLQQEE